MLNDPCLIIHFYRIEGPCERVPLTHGTIAEAVSAIQRVFYISDHYYTKAEIYRGNELIETVENSAYVRVESILIQ